MQIFTIKKNAQETNREYNGVLNDAVLNFTSLKFIMQSKLFQKVYELKKRSKCL